MMEKAKDLENNNLRVQCSVCLNVEHPYDREGMYELTSSCSSCDDQNKGYLYYIIDIWE